MADVVMNPIAHST